MRKITVPALIMAGDEDDPCIEASVLMKRSIATAALAILPRTGHALNLEEPAIFNGIVDEFFHQVEAGRWSARDPRSITDKIL
jgi:pimeloyl-ACP methyl ester carboxylesterase